MLLFIVEPCETSLNFIGLLKAQAPHLPYYSDQRPEQSFGFVSVLSVQATKVNQMHRQQLDSLFFMILACIYWCCHAISNGKIH